MKENERKRLFSSGIPMNVVSIGLIIVALIISAIVVRNTLRSVDEYQHLRTATERYRVCQQDAQLFREDSDLLTSESRYFVLTGKTEHAERYAEEIEGNRRREQGIETIDALLADAETGRYLNDALERSEALNETECYAMRLAADVWGVDPASLPPMVGEVSLQPGHAALSADEKRQVAEELLFGEDYQTTKDTIYQDVEQSISALAESNQAEQLASGDRLNKLLLRQRLLIVELLLLLLAMVSFMYGLVILPMRQAVKHIGDNQVIPVQGSYEMRFLARTYNEIFERHVDRTEKLTYSATHDALTGLFNRTAYENYRSTMDESTVGVLAIDVDEFKHFNDSFGHDVGDQVLKRVAGVLHDSFRSDDFVARVGGDEFCVVMKHADSRLKSLVEQKMRDAMEKLAQPENGLPSISISVGVAFGDRPNPAGDIFKDADTALYVVKRSGRGGCGFYGMN